MRKHISILVVILTCWSFNTDAQAPDLDRLIANITVAAPPVEALDLAAIQLHYFDSISPDHEQEKKMLTAYKALSAGFAANVHYKQGYVVFQKYLTLKEKLLAREKAEVIAKLQNDYRQNDKADEEKVVSLQNEVSQLNLDTEGFISKRSGFKNIFSIVIVVLSMLFAASLFRSGMRLKNLNTETKANQEKLAANHRLASLGYVADGIPGAFKTNLENVNKIASDAAIIAYKGKAEELQKALKGFSASSN
ncbi:hypothetical protein BH11BAC1_BH11BAC1_06250 [soil metagenome]